MFHEHRLLSRHFEDIRDPEETSESLNKGGNFLSSLGERVRSLFGRASREDREEVRGTVNNFNREYNALRNDLVSGVRSDVPGIRSYNQLGGRYGNERNGMRWNPQTRRLSAPPDNDAFAGGETESDGSHGYDIDVDDDAFTSVIGVDDEGADLFDIYGEGTGGETGVPAIPAETNAFRVDTGGATRLLEEFRKETAQFNQQRDKVINDSMAKLEALRQEMIKDEAAEDAAAARPALAPVQPLPNDLPPPAAVQPLPGSPPATVVAPSGAPTDFPTTPEAIRERFRYTAERFGTPEAYARTLAEQLNTDARWNSFLAAMFEYTPNRPGTPARMINLDNSPDADVWVPPLTFMTTYNTAGKMFGDCEDLAFFATHIANLQGKTPFSLGLNSDFGERKNDGTFGIKTEGGHVLTGWFETGTDGRRVARMVSTHGLRENGVLVSQARIFTATANPGETDDALLTRMYAEASAGATTVPANLRTLDTARLQTTHVLPNGNGFDIHGNLSLVRRHMEIDALLQRTPSDYFGVVRILREEIVRDPSNAGLHSSLVQFLLLANDRPAVGPALDALLVVLRSHPMTNRNAVSVVMTNNMLGRNGFIDDKTRDLNGIIQAWLQANLR